jgi:4'-phosphopantetheinyl transferase
VPSPPPRATLDGVASALRPQAGVDLWRFDLDRPMAGALALLSPDERARADRYAFARDRMRFVAGRAALRVVLGAYVEAPPEAIVFELGSHGKPRLPGGPPFSYSSSLGCGLCAVGGTRPLGVDVEELREVPDAAAIAESTFTLEERAAWRAAGGDGCAAFLRVWARKEAVLKALGVGLVGAVDDDDRAEVEVHDVEVDADHVAALAITAAGRPAP